MNQFNNRNPLMQTELLRASNHNPSFMLDVMTAPEAGEGDILKFGLRDVILDIARSRYSRECAALDAFIARGADIHVCSNALQNKFGVCVKSMYLILYAYYEIEKRNQP